MKMLATATAILFNVSLGSALSVPANADTSDIPSVTVKFADLDISRPAGATKLYGRIHGAARLRRREHPGVGPVADIDGAAIPVQSFDVIRWPAEDQATAQDVHHHGGGRGDLRQARAADV